MSDKRPETGPMQFGDDWPGIFIRGDNALGYGLSLQTLLDNPEAAAIYRGKLRALAGLLLSCDARLEPDVQNARLHDTRWSFDKGVCAKLLQELEPEGFDGFDIADAAIMLDAVWRVVDSGSSIHSGQESARAEGVNDENKGDS